MFDHRTFSAVSGSIDGTEVIGTSFADCAGGVLIVKVPMNVLMSLMGASAAYVQSEYSARSTKAATDRRSLHPEI